MEAFDSGESNKPTPAREDERTVGAGHATANPCAADSSQKLSPPKGYGESPKPVGPSNTTGLNPHTQEKNNQSPETGGIDTLEIKVFGWFNRVLHTRNCERLAIAREAARADDTEGAMLQLAGRTFLVGRGAPKGFAYVLDCEGFNLCISESTELRVKAPAVKVTISALVLLRMGHQQAWDAATAILRQAFQLDIRSTMVSRVDLCVDMPEQPPEEFVELINDPNRCITRIKKMGGNWELHEPLRSIRLGSSDQMMRVYDKALEIRKQSPHKRQLMIERRWSGREPSIATRLEFQLRREKLREKFNVCTVEEVFSALPAIADRLTSDVIRLVVHYDRKNPDRAEDHPLWKQVRTLFQSWTGTKIDYGIEIEERLPDPERNIRQAVGNLESAMAVTGASPDTPGQFLYEVALLIESYCAKSPERIAVKRHKQIASGKRQPEPEPWAKLIAENPPENRAA